MLVVSWGAGDARGVVSLEAVCGRWGKVKVGRASWCSGREVIVISPLRDALLARCSGRVSQMRKTLSTGLCAHAEARLERRGGDRARYLNI